jgi:hypothetical protein
MQLRRADASDIELLARWNFELISDECHRNPMDTAQLADRMRTWLSSEYTALVVYEAEAPVGYALFRRHEEGASTCVSSSLRESTGDGAWAERLSDCFSRPSQRDA